jgi:CDP-diacylglycerol--glycerol-3-phosphate 3-phosphatidyltransferase
MTGNDWRQTAENAIARPFVLVLRRTGVSPNALTIVGLAITLGSAVLVATGNFLAGGLVLIGSSLFDMLDGALARATGKTTRFGALLDSTCDRFSEGAMFFALVFYYAPQGMNVEVWLAVGALVGSFLISYIRARAEGLGIECKVGFFTRAERIVVLVAGLLFASLWGPLMLFVLWILAVLSFATALQRVIYVWLKTRRNTDRR